LTSLLLIERAKKLLAKHFWIGTRRKPPSKPCAFYQLRAR